MSFLWFIIAGLILLIPTGYAAWIGAPYAPTRLRAPRRAFDLLRIGPGDTLVDLGVGDGSILLEAAKRGAKAYGYELSPIMYAIVRLRVLGKKANVRFGNFYKHTYPDATVVFAFLMPDNMYKVERLIRTGTGPKLEYVLVYAFPFKNITPMQVVREKNCAPLYVYEAKAFRN